MCNCYGHECLLCEEKIPMHLGDFDTSPGEINVICWHHNFNALKSYLENAVLWFMDLYASGHLYDDEMEDGGYTWKEAMSEVKLFGGKTILVQALTDNARENWKVNHPNTLTGHVPVQGSWFTTNSEEGEA